MLCLSFRGASSSFGEVHSTIMPTAAEVAAGGVPQEDHDPFGVLRNANTVLLQNLRRDESLPELQKQLTSTGLASTSQAYFCDPYTNSYLGPQVRQLKRTPTAFFEFASRDTPTDISSCGGRGLVSRSVRGWAPSSFVTG